ncbi:hypothetical protein [Acetobacter pasteurianus]|uniref:hypothetical protein n=1 Tax=Acetobacter pasteurianus TaxID=438 RepID=UPI00286AB029|nr:hypothetical protein [Acetobacter pasteurianus]WKC16721.1 hypothetical protein FCN51_15840 [Acetobacter pasteurianus]
MSDEIDTTIEAALIQAAAILTASHLSARSASGSDLSDEYEHSKVSSEFYNLLERLKSDYPKPK